MSDGREISGIELDESDEHGSPANDERSHTFRQRRLTYTSHHLQAFSEALLADSDLDDKLDDGDESQDDSDKLSADTKRKMNEVEHGSCDKKRTRSNLDQSNVLDAELAPSSANENEETEKVSEASVASTSTAAATSAAAATAAATATPPKIIKSRVLHASAPPKPSCPHRQCHLLYQHPPNVNDTLADDRNNFEGTDAPHPMAMTMQCQPEPEWKKTHTSRMVEDGALPFPRTMVGTYSCHGIEPVYETDEFHFGSNGGRSAPTAIAKINQDRGGIAFPYANCLRTALFAAYDGHGEGGELVAQYALHEIPKRLESHEDFKKGNFEQAFKDIFNEVNFDLEGEKDIEPLYSGCTACVALVKDNTIYLSNAGDSRAVMASKKGGDNTTASATEHIALDLTIDQNPDSPGEQERIEMSGGFVSPPPEEGLSARVWLDAKFSQIGLAMARSIGDYAVKKVGVVAEPVVTTHEITDSDDFMIIATDGVWEFLSSQDAVDIVSKDFQDGECSSLACQHLIEAAAAKWHEHEGDYRDDITALVIKVQELWTS